MSDREKYLERLNQIREEHRETRTQREKERKDSEKESDRRYRFREARKIYKGTKDKNEKSKFITDELNQARYFLGKSPRGVLDSEAAEEYFGEQYARDHFSKGYVGARLVTPPGLVGMSLFIVGVVGMFLSYRKKQSK